MSWTFFWRPQDEWGWLGQWYASPFTLDGVEYGTCEQYMMAEKARLFGDAERLALILDCPDPQGQKALGRQVEGFDAERWSGRDAWGRPRCWSIVWRGNMAKFSQDPVLRERLLGTAGTTLVEASPFDKIWGIGLEASDARARDPAQWRGRNWLGSAIQAAREVLSEDASPYLTRDDPRRPPAP